MKPVTRDEYIELINQYLRVGFIGNHPDTAYRNQTTLDAYDEFMFFKLEKTELDMENIDDYAEWVMEINNTRRGEGRREAHAHMIRFFKYLMRIGMMTRPPSDIVRRPRILCEPNTKPLITVAEYEALKQAAIGTVVWWPIIAAWATGMSMVDVSKLKIDEVDMTSWCITKRRSKSGSPCIIPIISGSDFHGALLDKMKNIDLAHPAHRPDENIFYVDPYLAHCYLTDGGKFVKAAFDRIRKLAGLPPTKTFHCLRVSFCSMAANSNMNLGLACKMSGHRDPQTFVRRYLKVDPTVLHRVLREAREQQNQNDGNVFL